MPFIYAPVCSIYFLYCILIINNIYVNFIPRFNSFVEIVENLIKSTPRGVIGENLFIFIELCKTTGGKHFRIKKNKKKRTRKLSKCYADILC